jgi:uncharacterized membrane protein YhaH (DUF805 family)
MSFLPLAQRMPSLVPRRVTALHSSTPKGFLYPISGCIGLYLSWVFTLTYPLCSGKSQNLNLQTISPQPSVCLFKGKYVEKIMEWYIKVLKNYAVFSGRSRRKEYWMFFLINLIIAIALGVIESILGIPGILGGIYSLAVLIPGIAVSIRRLHDTDRTGWWLLIGLVPLVGLIVLIVFMVQEGVGEENQYGTNPKIATA